ncbi:MAG: molybdopterin synthase catalytic subunit MoaE [Alphaproteobacteria bacterium]|nr:molybdopterin synthase catalytic subunit MoaE [Alphaproteobacteria bacterium SS10]
MSVRVGEADFDAGVEIKVLTDGRRDVGGVATFIGLVRDRNEGTGVSDLTLEHYPGMTEKALNAIEQQARERWPLIDVTIIHRVGRLSPGDQIVFVGTTSAHRAAAFEACDFIMDYLKTEAPFWKAETTAEGETRWVEARASDDEAKRRWATD